MIGSNTKLKYWNPYLGGTLLGILLFLSFFVVGHGLGASGGVNRIAVAVEDMVGGRCIDRRLCLRHVARPGQAADLSRTADILQDPLGLCLRRWCFGGLWCTPGARLHLRSGTERRCSHVRWQLGLHVCGICRWLRACLVCQAPVGTGRITMAPFDLVATLGATGSYLVYLGIGFCFGFILESCGFGDSRKLAVHGDRRRDGPDLLVHRAGAAGLR